MPAARQPLRDPASTASDRFPIRHGGRRAVAQRMTTVTLGYVVGVE